MLGGSEAATAVRSARAVVEHSPLRESANALLMEALAARGDVAEALQVYDRLRRLLADELGPIPSAAVAELHARLLRDGDRPDRRSVAPASTPQLALPPRLAARPAGALIGRDAQLASLEAGLRRARAGERRLVALGGEPGIGKTRLSAEIGRPAHAMGANVLCGRSGEEGLLPYQPFVEALGHWAATAPPESIAGPVADAGAHLARSLPELARRGSGLAGPPTGDPETVRYALFDAVVCISTRFRHEIRSCSSSTICIGPTRRRYFC